MKFAISGSSGFIGSHLLESLSRDGHDVTRIERGMGFKEMETLFKEFKPDVVFHLASLFIAEHKSEDIPALIDSNLLFGTNLLEAMAKTGTTRLINAGTSWQHFENADYNPVCLYAATKEAFEKIIEFYVETSALKVHTLKLFDTYGPKDPRPKLVPKLMLALKSGLRFDLSPGEQQLDLTYIDDVVSAFTTAANNVLTKSPEDHGFHKSWAVGSGEIVTLKELVETIELVAGKKFNASFGGRPYRSREVMRLWDRGEQVPDWNAKTKLIEGLKKTWDVVP